MTRNIGVNFNGQHLVHPQAKAMTDANGLSTLGTPGAKKIVFVGSSEGGEPGVVNWFDNPADAKDVLRSGDLYTAGELAWSPGGDGVGAGAIGFLRVEDATQSKLTKDSLTITSLDWGSHTNKTQVSLEDGSLTGSKKLKFYYWPDNITEVYDNLGPIFNLTYTGTETYAALDIAVDSTTDKATGISIKVGADSATATEVLAYNLADGQFSDVNKVVFDINEHTDFTASMVTTGNKNVTSDTLDSVDAQDIKNGYAVTALKGDILQQTKFSRLVSVSFDATGTFPTNFSYEYLTGGTNGAVPASWTDLFNKLYGEGAYFVVPLTSDEAIHAECARFVNSQSDIEGNRMLGFYGGDLGESLDDVIGRSLTFSSSRAVVCYPGITRKASDGEVEFLPAFFTAALAAGRQAGKETGDPITLDYLTLIGVEVVLTGTEIDRLIENGVTVIEFVRNRSAVGYRIAQGVTTYQQDSNPSYREISMRIVSDELNAELEEELETSFAGGRGTTSVIALVKNTTQSFLDRKKRDEVIVDYDPESVQVHLEGDKVYVDYRAIPTGAINYILITARYYQTTISA